MSSDQEAFSAGLSPQAELARRLNLLLDVVVAERGQPVTFREVQQKLQSRGIKLSRARWFYMKDGTGRLVSDPALLGLCVKSSMSTLVTCRVARPLTCPSALIHSLNL
ncbi:hypothetical protein NG819_16295 [Pseudarthrobacter sp. Fe7]|nr:hypothetical protein NG819_16295 [Pseudarthrobacter sp. Fe7]